MSTETKTDREMLAEIMHAALCGCSKPPGRDDMDAADAILASDWLRDRDGGQRLLGAVRISGDYDEAKAWEDGRKAEARYRHDFDCWVKGVYSDSPVVPTNPYAETGAE